MNYRHAYHAGNFADVFKHLIVIALIEALKRKDKGFCYLETHAGAGMYDLTAASTQKSKEYENGVAKLLELQNPPDVIQFYLKTIAGFNSVDDPLHFYPGSPFYVKKLLRPQDRMVLAELHEEEYELLKKTFPHYKQVGIHHQDGYQALKAFLPPPEKRGLVLIDPPYEQPDELMQLVTTLVNTLKRWETGVYALWYPIKEYRAIERFHHAVRERISRPVLITELSIYPKDVATHLNGCGMLIVNPPWQLEEEIKKFLPLLWKQLSLNQKGNFTIMSR